MMAPEEAFVVTLVQMWGTEEASEEVTVEMERTPKATVPPLPANVPSQAVAAAWDPTFIVIMGSTFPETVTWSSDVITTVPEPGSSFTHVIV